MAPSVQSGVYLYFYPRVIAILGVITNLKLSLQHPMPWFLPIFCSCHFFLLFFSLETVSLYISPDVLELTM